MKSYSVRVDANVPLPLNDGTMTYVDIFRPSTSGKFPALLKRTPYDKSSANSRSSPVDAVRAAMQGYGVVIQDIRGRHSASGEFYPFVNEAEDGYHSVEWVASQPWCTGKVGMYGVSYEGATQWLAAKRSPPSLVAIAPGVTASDYHEGWTWQGGAFELGFNLSWAMGPLTGGNWGNLSQLLDLTKEDLEQFIDAKDNLDQGFYHVPTKEYPYLKGGLASYYYDWLSHAEYDDYWRDICIEDNHKDISIPAFNIGGWYDIFLGGTIRNYVGMRDNAATALAREGQRLLIGPWVHGAAPNDVSGQHHFGTKSSSVALDLPGLILAYYDYWLKGEDNGIGEEKPVRIFVMGENKWRLEDEWPLNRAINCTYYLHSRGRANTLNGDGYLSPESPNQEPPDIYVYNPMDPAPTQGGGLCCDPAFMMSGAYDQRSIEARPDVLVYTTSPMEEDMEVTGPIIVTLYGASSAVDTDFTAKLVDVQPCGCARNLTDGIIRARYRSPRQPASFINPGEIYEYRIDLWATSNLFRKGSCVRLEISSSNFPRFDRNTNTGGPITSENTFVAALQTIHHEADYPSNLRLPIVPRIDT